jgi:DNA-binding NarL/FixJ family response regulator
VESILKFLKLDENFEFIGVASDGQEAIKKVMADKPDIILMDIRMPGIDGIEATKLIKKSHPTIKIIIVTLQSDKEYKEIALSSGADGYITKSRFVEEFYPLINKLITIPEGISTK